MNAVASQDQPALSARGQQAPHGQPRSDLPEAAGDLHASRDRQGIGARLHDQPGSPPRSSPASSRWSTATAARSATPRRRDDRGSRRARARSPPPCVRGSGDHDADPRVPCRGTPARAVARIDDATRPSGPSARYRRIGSTRRQAGDRIPVGYLDPASTARPAPGAGSGRGRSSRRPPGQIRPTASVNRTGLVEAEPASRNDMFMNAPKKAATPGQGARGAGRSDGQLAERDQLREPGLVAALSSRKLDEVAVPLVRDGRPPLPRECSPLAPSSGQRGRRPGSSPSGELVPAGLEPGEANEQADRQPEQPGPGVGRGTARSAVPRSRPPPPPGSLRSSKARQEEEEGRPEGDVRPADVPFDSTQGLNNTTNRTAATTPIGTASRRNPAISSSPPASPLIE